MILVDNRNGSEDLAPQLSALGFDVELVRLPYGDIAFEGRGRADRPVQIAVELKKLTSGDLVSSIRTGRLSGHQLPGLIGPEGAYDYAWLVVEGLWRAAKDGRLLVCHDTQRGWRGKTKTNWQPVQGGFHASEMTKKLLTQEVCGGLHVYHARNRDTTLHFIGTLYRWWNDKPLDRHASHLQEHEAHGWAPISEFRAIVKRFPHIGLQFSEGVERHFQGSLVEAVCAGVDEWAAVQTTDKRGKFKRLGTKAAEDIVAFLRKKHGRKS